MKKLIRPEVTVVYLGIVAFIISFNSLRGLAADTGAIERAIAFLFPVLVDGAIVILARSALSESIKGRSTRKLMFGVFAFTALSVALNIVHAPADLVSRVIGATAPIALAYLVEMIVGISRADAVEQGVVSDIETKRAELDDIILRFQEATVEVRKLEDRHTELSVEVDSMTANRQRLQRDVEQMTSERDSLKRSLQTYRRKIDKAKPADDIVAEAHRVASAHPDWTQAQIGKEIGRSARTVKRYLDMPIPNGNGEH